MTRPVRAAAVAVALLLVAQVGAAVTYSPSAARPSHPLARAHGEGTPAHPLVGAHYHLWFPENFDQGFLRDQLVPPQAPALGRYHSDDPEVAEQQIAWASASGVDFFTLDWWPTRPEQNDNAVAGFLQADNIDDIRFCVFYEVWDLGFQPSQEATPMNRPSVDRFLRDMDDIATRFFEHPSYLRVNERPVVFLYLSRTMSGDVAGALAEARELLRRRGHDVFFVGDEIFWRPIRPERLRLYDAITAYNLYEHEKPEHHGYAAETSLVPDQVALYQQHAAATGGQVPVIPAVVPGYNDRGVRPRLDHYVLPRRWSAADPEGSLLRQMISLVARPLVDGRVPMLFVTSWNEWNEDTAIEPLAPAPETDQPGAVTGGYAYGGGSLQLDALRDEVVAVAGRVVDEDGEPEPGVRVEARRDGRLLAADVTDARGAYTLSRWLIEPGPVEVSGAGVEARTEVRIEVTALVDLAI